MRAVGSASKLEGRDAPAAVNPGDEGIDVRSAPPAAHNPAGIQTNDRQILGLSHRMHYGTEGQLKPRSHGLI